MNSLTLDEIENLRRHLYHVVEQHDGNLLHPQVIGLSEELDRQILEWISQKNQSS